MPAPAAKIEWQSLLGPLTRLSVFPREFVGIAGGADLTFAAADLEDVLLQPYGAEDGGY